MVYAETEREGNDLWSKYFAGVKDTLVPIDQPKRVAIDTIPDVAAANFPKARYETQANSGNGLLYSMSDEEISPMLEPVVDMWLSDDKPPPPSSSLFFAVHPAVKSLTPGGKVLATGFTPSLVVMTCAIFTKMPVSTRTTRLNLRLLTSTCLTVQPFASEMVNGDVPTVGAASCFTKDAFEEVQQKIALLDPSEVYAGFP